MATQLFKSATVNAEPKLLAEFRKEADRAKENLTDEQKKVLELEMAPHLGGRAEFSALLATLRMCAFIHDLGHLPCSHVFENALESFISPAIEKTIKIAKEVKPLRDELKELLKEKSPKEDGEPDKIHERLGLQLANGLAADLGSRPHTDVKAHLASSIIGNATKLLISHQFPITESFIKGTVDADRIDFTRRDGHFSGLFSSSVDYGRLFTLYTLEEAEEKGRKKIVARPSPRAVSETEKLLWERFQDYKYIVMHHKVHFYDEVVENMIVRLLSSGRLTVFLKDLIGLLKSDSDKHHTIKEKHQQWQLLESILLEFDDPWMESHIRSIYRKIVENRARQQDTLDEETEILYQVYVEDRRRFTSAFKSDEEFWSAVNKYAPRLAALRPKENKEPNSSGEDIIKKRGFFFSALYAVKFSLQAALKKELKRSVIIGPTDRKVNYGVRNDDLARFYHVSELVDFLKNKKYDTMLFNMWFDSHSGMTKAEFLKKALPIIEKAIFAATNDMQGIQELSI